MNFSRISRYIFVVWLLLLVPLMTKAQSMTDTIFSLNEVIVTANRFTEVIPSQKLTGKELEGLSSLSVADALRYFSGVQLKDYGGVGGIKTVNIRSMGSEQMGVYYNGIQLGNAQNGQVDLGKFSLENIEEISLYNGQRSDIFQTAREFGSAGSIYLTTRRPKFKSGERANLKAGIKAGSFDFLNPSVLFEYKITDDIYATFNAEWINASGKYEFRYRRVTPSGELAYDTTAVRENGDIDAVRFEGGVQGYMQRGKWKAYMYHYTSERGIPGAIVNNVWHRGERLWDRNSFVQGMFEYDITSALSTRINAKYAFDYTHYVNNDDKLIHVDNIYKQREVYLSWANRYKILPGWEASLAYDYQWDQLSEFKDVDRHSHWVSLATAYALGDCFKVQASALATIVDEEAHDGIEVPDKFKVTPALFLSYKPFERSDLIFRAFYKQSYRMPTFNDLYYTDMGNAFLKPELATQYNVGVVYDLDRNDNLFSFFRIGADVYYNKVKDKIVAYPKGQQFRWTMLNLGMVDIRGIDAQAMAVFRFPYEIELTTKLQYTYQEAIDITNPNDSYYRHQIPYIPWHSGSAIVMLSWRGWSLNYSFIYVGERYNQQENIIYNYTQPWYTNDVSLVKSFKLKDVLLKATVEVNNLLDQDYDVILNYPMPKRNYRVGLSVEI